MSVDLQYEASLYRYDVVASKQYFIHLKLTCMWNVFDYVKYFKS